MPKKLAQIFPNAPIVAYRKDKPLKDLLVRARTPASKSYETLVFGDIQSFSFSRFLERQSRLSDKKAFSSLELYFFRLKKQKGVICGKEDDNITTMNARYRNMLCSFLHSTVHALLYNGLEEKSIERNIIKSEQNHLKLMTTKV